MVLEERGRSRRPLGPWFQHSIIVTHNTLKWVGVGVNVCVNEEIISIRNYLHSIIMIILICKPPEETDSQGSSYLFVNDVFASLFFVYLLRDLLVVLISICIYVYALGNICGRHVWAWLIWRTNDNCLWLIIRCDCVSDVISDIC